MLLAAIAIGLYPLAVAGLRSLITERKIGTELFVTAATLIAVAGGEYVAAAVLMTIILIAEFIADLNTERARASIKALIGAAPRTAVVRAAEGERTIPIEEVQPGAIVLVRAGDRVPVDGTVAAGTAAVNEATITGESIPVDKTVGSPVLAGTIVESGALDVHTGKVGADTMFARIIALVEQAESTQAPVQTLADRVATWLVPVVVVFLVAVFLITHDVRKIVALLIFTSPAELGLATPMVMIAAIARAARMGILVKGGLQLELLAKADTMVFDKTGTLTVGEPEVVQVSVHDPRMSEQEVLRYAAAADRRSAHPLARAVVAAAERRGVAVPEAEAFESLHGLGVIARVEGRQVAVGNEALRKQQARGDGADTAAHGGRTVAYIVVDGTHVGTLSFADRTRPGAREALVRLRESGIRKIVMVTGDNEAVARRVARELEIDDVRASLLPEQKVTAVDELRRGGARVAMVGDGVNDAPALAHADVGIAMGARGTQAALEAADIALMTDDLAKIAAARALAKRAYRTIQENLLFGVGVVHVLGIAAALAGWIGPIQAAMLHLGPDVLVFLNSVKLLRVSVGVALLVALLPARLDAQASFDGPPFTSRLTASALADLPSTGNLFGILETTQGPLVSDRFSNGLNPSEPARLGFLLESWTQTAYRIGDVDITSARGGAPMLLPQAAMWQRVSVTSGFAPADATSGGATIVLDPPTPSEPFAIAALVQGSREALVTGPVKATPAIARSVGWSHASGSIGMARGAAAVFAAGSITRNSQADRATEAARSGIDSLLSHVAIRRGQHALRLVGWLESSRYPYAHDVVYAAPGTRVAAHASHLQATWERRTAGSASLRVFAAGTARSRNTAAAALVPAPVIERLRDGPPSAAGVAGEDERKWSAGIRAQGVRARTLRVSHGWYAGADAAAVTWDIEASGPVSIAETVGGLPARTWSFSAAEASRRTRRHLAIFAGDRVALGPRVEAGAALRLDATTARARSAVQGITWATWLPRGSVRWRITNAGRVTAFTAVSRTADVVNLDVLANGDPAAPTADVRLWNGTATGALVARFGPGSGPGGELTTVDAHLLRPVAREFLAGLELTPRGWPRMRFTSLRKRASRQLTLVNAGAPASSYTVSYVPDVGPNGLDPRDDKMLPIYNRRPASFGADRYLLTNAAMRPSDVHGMTFATDGTWNRAFLFAEATMGWTMGWAGNRGFGPAENDIGVVGELLTNPNAATHARGNLFTDRQYTVKISGVYRFAHDVRAGVVARYQDGQAFSRMVIAADLNQGPEAIRAFRSGKSRFTYTGTLDVRLQKGFTFGPRRLAVLADVFNIVNMAKEVEEWVVTGPAYRMETAIQPPRTIFLGVRLSS